MKNIPYILLFVIWLFLAVVEMVAPSIVDNRIFFWRTWEYVIHEDSPNIDIIPFKPLQHESFYSIGDMARSIYFKPGKDELRRLEFITDEYGFRNAPYITKKPIDVVLLGTSQVAGSSETQSNLVANILEKKYHIPSYTYAKAKIQQFWENTKFKKNPPKYAVILGQDFEFTNNSYIELIDDTTANFSMTAWTKESWKESNESQKDKLFHVNYMYMSDYARRFSILRVASDGVFRSFASRVFNRTELMDIFGNEGGIYDSNNNFIFPTTELENPALGSTFKTKNDIGQAITILKTTNSLLKKRGITLIVGVMPTKSYLYAKMYQNFPKDKAAITYFDQEIDNAGIVRIPLFETIYDDVHTSDQPFYYPLDTHWSAKTNEVIADLLSKKIAEISKK